MTFLCFGASYGSDGGLMNKHVRWLTIGVALAIMTNIVCFYSFFTSGDTSYVHYNATASGETGFEKGHFCLFAKTDFSMNKNWTNAQVDAIEGVSGNYNTTWWESKFDEPDDDDTLMGFSITGIVFSSIFVLMSAGAVFFSDRMSWATSAAVLGIQSVLIAFCFVAIAFGYMTVITSVCFKVTKGASGIDTSNLETSVDVWEDHGPEKVFSYISIATLYLCMIGIFMITSSPGSRGTEKLPGLARALIATALSFQSALGWYFYDDFNADDTTSRCDGDSYTAEMLAHFVLVSALAFGCVWLFFIVSRTAAWAIMSRGGGTVAGSYAWHSTDTAGATCSGQTMETFSMVGRIVLFPMALVMLYANRMNHAACPGLAHIAFENGTNLEAYNDTDHIDGMAKSIFYIVLLEFVILSGSVMFVAAKRLGAVSLNFA